MKFLQATTFASLASCQTVMALKATILADTNRDGVVDTQDSTDKTEWTNSRGALFLANIADTDKRCSKQIVRSTTAKEMGACHDANDNTLRNSRFVAPLKTLPIDALSESATGRISVSPKEAESMVRIFNMETDRDWEFVGSNYTFTAGDLGTGLNLGIDARDVRRHDGWDGRVSVTFTVEDGSETAEDSVALRVAPVLTHHHAQKAERLFTTKARTRSSPQGEFVADLKKAAANVGITESVYEFTDSDVWTQDFFETAYSSIPGPDGPVVLRILIRSSQMYRTAGVEAFKLRDASLGAVQVIAEGASTDSMGNLETIPPYTLNGKSYPAGRIIQGSQDGELPKVFPFLQAQEVQDPLELDTDWLSVGHVDEFLQFLPSSSERGFVLMVADTREGIKLLKKAVADGHGDIKAFPRPSFPTDKNSDFWGCLPVESVKQILALDRFEELNEFAATRIEANLDILKRETGLTEEEIFRVPSTFYLGDLPCARTGSNSPATVSAVSKTSSSSHERLYKSKNILEATGSQRLVRRQAKDQLVAFWPGMVNGIVLTDTEVLVPKPWGPVVDGEDIFEAVARDLYGAVGFNTTFLDDWFSHHVGMGEIHCGSNVWRNADDLWWKN